MTYLTRRRFLQSAVYAATLAGVPALPVRAATLDLADLAKKANGEGELTYYASTNPVLSKKLVELFNEQYPDIKVNIVRLASGPLGRRYASEVQAGDPVADILQLGDPLLLEEGFEKGWFADLTELPAHQDWPEGYKERYLAVVSLFPHTITYNTNLVSGDAVPASWEDILDERWKGRILMADVRNSPSLMDWAALMHDTYGPDYLRRLAQQKPRIVASTLPGTQMVAAGEAAFVLPNLRMVSFSLIEKGAPLEDVTPSPNSGLESMLAISKNAKNPNAARLFSNFILTRPAQAVLSAEVASSPLEGIDGELALPEGFRRAELKTAISRGPEIAGLLGLT